MFIGICSRSQVSVYRTIGPLVNTIIKDIKFDSLLYFESYHGRPPWPSG